MFPQKRLRQSERRKVLREEQHKNIFFRTGILRCSKSGPHTWSHLIRTTGDCILFCQRTIDSHKGHVYTNLKYLHSPSLVFSAMLMSFFTAFVGSTSPFAGISASFWFSGMLSVSTSKRNVERKIFVGAPRAWYLLSCMKDVCVFTLRVDLTCRVEWKNANLSAKPKTCRYTLHM